MPYTGPAIGIKDSPTGKRICRVSELFRYRISSSKHLYNALWLRQVDSGSGFDASTMPRDHSCNDFFIWRLPRLDVTGAISVHSVKFHARFIRKDPTFRMLRTGGNGFLERLGTGSRSEAHQW